MLPHAPASPPLQMHGMRASVQPLSFLAPSSLASVPRMGGLALGRSGGDLGSSKGYPATSDLGSGYFSTDPAQNPMMHD